MISIKRYIAEGKKDNEKDNVEKQTVTLADFKEALKKVGEHKKKESGMPQGCGTCSIPMEKDNKNEVMVA